MGHTASIAEVLITPCCRNTNAGQTRALWKTNMPHTLNLCYTIINADNISKLAIVRYCLEQLHGDENSLPNV
jgi:hypothetical protein